MKPIKKTPWAHSIITKLNLNYSSREGSPVFPRKPVVGFDWSPQPYLPMPKFRTSFPIPNQSQQQDSLFSNFQISVKPNIKHNSGWWNLAGDWKKKKTKHRPFTKFSPLLLPKWTLGRQRQLHAVMFYQFTCSWHMLDHHVVYNYTES